MRILSKNPNENQITEFIESFVNLLAEEKYIEAFDLTYKTHEHMSPELIERLIKIYSEDKSDDKENFRVTALEKMQRKSPKTHFYWYDELKIELPKEIGSVEYDLPINNEWSDLTLIFYIHELENGIALSIYDLHVL